MRYAGQAFELPVPGAARARPGRPGRALRARARGALRPPRPRRRGRPRRHPPGAGRPGPGAAPGRGRRRARSSESARPVALRRRVGRDAGPARRARRPALEAEGPVVFELPEATLVVPPGWRRRGRRRRHDPCGRAHERTSDERRSTRSRLQVLIGGLRAACDEMGATLIRSAYSANIKERHDCSTALFDAARRAGDAGRAHPRPPRLDARRGRRGARRGAAPRRRLDPQRPLPRRHPPARHHPDLAGLRRRRAARLRRQPRPPRRRRRPDPGRDAGRLDAPRGGGRGDPADPRRATTSSSELAGADAHPRASASPTCAPSGPPTGSASGGSPSSPSATAASRCAPGWRRSSPTPSAAPAPRSPSCPTATYEAEDVLEDDAGGAERDIAPAGRGDDRRRRACTLDFTGTDPQVEGNLNCPLSVTKSAAFFAVRVLTDPDAPPSRRRLPADRGDRARGLPAQRPLPGRGRRRQRRDLEPGRRPRDRRPRRRPRRSPPRARGR